MKIYTIPKLAALILPMYDWKLTTSSEQSIICQCVHLKTYPQSKTYNEIKHACIKIDLGCHLQNKYNTPDRSWGQHLSPKCSIYSRCIHIFPFHYPVEISHLKSTGSRHKLKPLANIFGKNTSTGRDSPSRFTWVIFKTLVTFSL